MALAPEEDLARQMAVDVSRKVRQGLETILEYHGCNLHTNPEDWLIQSKGWELRNNDDQDYTQEVYREGLLMGKVTVSLVKEADCLYYAVRTHVVPKD